MHSKNSVFNEYCQEITSNIPFDGKILFVQLPQFDVTSFDRQIALTKGYYVFPPTGIQYLCESIKHYNFQLKVLDLNLEILKAFHTDNSFDPVDWPQIFEASLDELAPTLVCFSCLFDVGIGPLLQAIRITRARESSITLAGGVIATYEWEKLIADDLCHFVIEGEGENKLNYLLGALIGEGDLVAQPDIHFRSKSKNYTTTGNLEEVKLEGDLIDTYKLIDINEYCKYGSLNPYSRDIGNNPSPFGTIQFTRGCRAACNFCSVRDFMGKGLRARAVGDLIKEMKFLIGEGVEQFELLDDDPTFFKKEFKAFLRTIIANNWNIKFSASNGIIAASVDEELMGLLRDSGCIGFSVGFESGNPEMLKKMQKPGNLKSFIDFTEKLQRYPEMFVKGNYIVGHSGENFGQMLESLQFSLDYKTDWAAFAVCQIIRGASAFADSGEYFESQMKAEGRNIVNRIPTRDSLTTGQLDENSSTKDGLDIFDLDPKIIPDKNQLKEIWFTFNLLSNYICNKNLAPEGIPEKFINWVERVHVAYPKNAYMPLFLALAYVLTDDLDTSEILRQKAQENMVASGYWKKRLHLFSLDSVIKNFPRSKEDVYSSLKLMEFNFSQYIEEH